MQLHVQRCIRRARVADAAFVTILICTCLAFSIDKHCLSTAGRRREKTAPHSYSSLSLSLSTSNTHLAPLTCRQSCTEVFWTAGCIYSVRSKLNFTPHLLFMKLPFVYYKKYKCNIIQ